jgi:predicted peroxiredoxin
VGVVAVFAVADALRSERPSTSDAAPPLPTPILSSEERIERIGNEWAPRFAADTTGARCFHMTQPLCERIACVHVGGVKIPNCRPPSSAFRRSFEEAVVEEVAIEGDRVAARFTNGEVIEFHGDGGTWMVARFGANAGRGLFD